MKVGVFDSGVGGLTVLRAIRKELNRVDLIYLGDTARVPYGNKSPKKVIAYSLECAEFLLSKGVDILVVACNTASSYAVEILKDRFHVPVIGVVEPGVEEALKVSSGKVGVIGTTATIRSGSYQKLLERNGIEVLARDCPLFVPLVEEGLIKGSIASAVVEHYLSDLKGKIDTLILGCTHYPLLKEEIRNFLGDVNIVDSSEAVARKVKKIVKNEGQGKTDLFFTDRSQNLEKIVKLILNEDIPLKVLRELEVELP